MGSIQGYSKFTTIYATKYSYTCRVRESFLYRLYQILLNFFIYLFFLLIWSPDLFRGTSMTDLSANQTWSLRFVKGSRAKAPNCIWKKVNSSCLKTPKRWGGKWDESFGNGCCRFFPVFALSFRRSLSLSLSLCWTNNDIITSQARFNV